MGIQRLATYLSEAKMKVKIERGTAHGCIDAPRSKSMAHRLLICAALSDGASHISGITDCDDVKATCECLKKLGADIEISSDTYTVRGFKPEMLPCKDELYCHESGSTIRFLIPIAALSDKEITLSGAPQLMRRPFDVYERLFTEKGLDFTKTDDGKIKIKGPLCGGEYSLPGDISSQFITGLLFALPLAKDDSIIRLTTKIESLSYINMTVGALEKFGVEADFSESEQSIYIKGSQAYRCTDATVEGDFSGAAFIDALNLIGGDVKITGLKDNSLQGDKAYRKLYPMLKEGSPTIDIHDCPDLGPILFAMAAANNGAEFINTARLKIKESDRAATMKEELSKLGCYAEVYENRVTVPPCNLHTPTIPISSHGDHRIAMAMATLLTLVGGEITEAEAINKSYPEFFAHLEALGIGITYND